MKKIEVCAAIIVKDGKVFVTQRGYGDFKDKWEFPGGKIKEGESGENCVVREIKEELDADIEVINCLSTVEYTYSAFHLIMHNYICKLKSDHLLLLEHEAAAFIDVDQLDKIDFLPADKLILDDIRKAI